MFENGFLELLHHCRVVRIVIVVAVEVEQSVDDVERALALRIVMMCHRLTDRGISADEDFAVLESDDIRGRGIVHELRVRGADDVVADEGNFHLFKIRQERFVRPGIFDHERQGFRCGMEKSFHIQRQSRLMIVEFQRRHESKIFFRGATAASLNAAGRPTTGAERACVCFPDG